MLNILFSPKWFYGKDIIIDIVSIFVLLLIAYFNMQYYKLDRRKKGHMFFSVATSFLALSFFFKIITNFTLYQYVLEKKQFGLMTIIYQTVQYSDTLFLVGTLLFRLFTLLGFYILFSIYCKKQQKPIYFLIIYFIIMITYFTLSEYHVFHLTTLILLLFLIKKYYDNYLKTKDKPAGLIFWSFLTIALSQLIFIFIGINNTFYVVAESVQLFGYLLLVISFIMVRKYGKKKNSS
ncbi:hypothetical protein HOI26_02375 [Candidatus Woesearchaeota archaeon]|jgi:hypothetical protein|nr:hypothetical protein [Candidatus Woesearchaeota archaeon]MBT5739924.1 hypothetical protein [Candidatus Woesearchaeota archaeon]